MEGIYLLVALIVVHLIFFFFDVLFKSCSHVPYLLFLQNTGLEVSFLRLRWFTAGLNRSFQRWGRWRPQVQAIWFSVGVACSLVLMPVAAFLVLRGLFASTSAQPTPEPLSFELEPVIPGLNLPLNQLGNYMMALAVSGLLHELGHALAAAREGVPVLGCGAQLIVLLPIASVDLSTQRLASLPTWRRLRVLCAGVWHNVVLALLALLVLNAVAITPLYTLGKGVSVSDVAQNSGISGPAGLKAGDHVTGIDQCVVKDSRSWHLCLLRAAKSPHTSYCVPQTLLVGETPAGPGECCPQQSSRHLCFHNNKTRWCLRARDVIEVAGNKAPPCAQSDVTLTPDLANNMTRLLVIQRSNFKRAAVLFLGPPRELRRTVGVSDWLPALSGLPPWLPESLSYASSYIAALSSGLALLNLLPCYGFDGQHIINLLVEVALSCVGVRSACVASTIGAGFTAVGTGCLLAWLSLAVYKIVPPT